MDWSQVDDVDALWQALRRARQDGDQTAADAIKARMAEVQASRRYVELDDLELERRIAALRRKDTPEPINGAASDITWTSEYVDKLNGALREAADQVDRADLAGLVAEKKRRLAARGEANT